MNRVVLSGPEDYINASHIRVSVGKEQRHYIATQGPLQQTTGDFWRMVWEQRVQVIAMVTQDVENDKVKCHRYWPDSAATPFTVYNRYELSLTRVQRLHHFDVHHIAMEDLETGRVHRLLHLNFTSWPEQGAPDSGRPLLQVKNKEQSSCYTCIQPWAYFCKKYLIIWQLSFAKFRFVLRQFFFCMYTCHHMFSIYLRFIWINCVVFVWNSKLWTIHDTLILCGLVMSYGDIDWGQCWLR